MAPSASGAGTALVDLLVERRLGLVRVADLQEVYLIRRDCRREILHALLEFRLQLLFGLVDQAGFGGRVRPLVAGGLEGVEAEADVWTVDFVDNVPDVGPGGRVGRPAPVLVGEAEVVLCEHVGELLEVFDEEAAVHACQFLFRCVC